VVWVPDDMIEELDRLRARREQLTREMSAIRENIEDSLRNRPARRPHD
jgi:hypothetical protein